MNDIVTAIITILIITTLSLIGWSIYLDGIANHHANIHDKEGNITCEICKKLMEGSKK